MVATNLAVALARDGMRVGLLDADIYGPNIPLMFGETRPPGHR
jgi:ATP-binding protein involved in chromosome partitioning